MIKFSAELVHVRSLRRDRLLQEVSCLILNLSITNVKLLYAKKFNLIDLCENIKKSKNRMFIDTVYKK